ncbi:MAG: hypothetical protein JWQ89_3334 [Devosia sp.]|uniref:DUF7448 domain-containing protein n=1 Tax=Devosia sp. TaxID=1871048 RepID=UPI002638EC27|nr:hypothetical protein [Devosia sp.]MDB5541607.1 hypothetical protein [Devosia sp.]
MTGLNDLVGKVVQSLWVEEGEHNLVIKTDGGDCNLHVEGDCCSESWFADFLGVDTLLNQSVVKVEEVEMPDYDTNDNRGRQDEDQVYGYRFTTARGYADLIFRNSSNGYYGGWLNVSDNQSIEGFVPILSDWKA